MCFVSEQQSGLQITEGRFNNAKPFVPDIRPPTVLEEFRENRRNRKQADEDWKSGKRYSEKLRNIRLGRELVDDRFLHLQGGKREEDDEQEENENDEGVKDVGKNNIIKIQKQIELKKR